MDFILDCSVTMSWCFADELTLYSKKVRSSLEEYSALVPVLWKIEVSNCLYTAHKKNRISEAAEFYFLELLKELSIQVSSIQLQTSEILRICKEHKLTAYDACYFHLAITQNLPLATLDKDLRHAVLKAGGKIYLE